MIALHLTYGGRVSLWNPECANLASLANQLVLGVPSLSPHSDCWNYRPPHPLRPASTQGLGIQALVPMLAWQALYPLSHFSQPGLMFLSESKIPWLESSHFVGLSICCLYCLQPKAGCSFPFLLSILGVAHHFPSAGSVAPSLPPPLYSLSVFRTAYLGHGLLRVRTQPFNVSSSVVASMFHMYTCISRVL